jgi:hypothetical protein
MDLCKLKVQYVSSRIAKHIKVSIMPLSGINRSVIWHVNDRRSSVCYWAEALVFVSATTSRPIIGSTHPRLQQVPLTTWLRMKWLRSRGYDCVGLQLCIFVRVLVWPLLATTDHKLCEILELGEDRVVVWCTSWCTWSLYFEVDP